MISDSVKSQIVNYTIVEKDVLPLFVKQNHRRVILSSRIHREKYEFGANDYDSFIKRITNLSNSFPSEKCVVVAKVDEHSNIHVELYPVTGAA